MTNLGRARVNQQGFTLTELLVAIAIVGLVMTGLLTLLKKGNESYLAGANQVEAQAAVRAALERMTQELREAGYNPQGLPACTAGLAPPACMDAIINQSATSFTLQNDWNGNGIIEPGITVPLQYFFGGVATNVNRGEQITYSIVGGTLQRQESAVDAVPQPLVTNVVQATVGAALQPFFQYLDQGDIVAGPPVSANLRTVVVNLQVGVQGQTPGSWQTGAVQVAMSDRIRLRNR